MAVKKGTGQIKDSGFSRPYGPVSTKDAKKISDAIKKESTKKTLPKIIGAKPGVKKNLPKIEGTKPGVKKPMPKILGPIKPIRVNTPKPTPTKKKVLVMPDKISPSKMTPAQKARYLKNPERYDG